MNPAKQIGKPGHTARSSSLLEKKQELKCLSAYEGHKGGSGNGELKSFSAEWDENKSLEWAIERTAQGLTSDRSEAMQFPVEVFPKALQQFVSQGAISMSCTEDCIATTVLATVASFIGPDRPIELKPGWQERPCIYAANIAPTGKRKSPASELAMTPARERDRLLEEDYRRDKQEYEKRRQQAKKEGKDFNECPPHPMQHVTSDTTVEALAEILHCNPHGLLVHRDELSGWVASQNQYRGGRGSDRQFWLSAWSSQDYTVNRKGKDPLRINRPFLCVIGNIPPQMLGELADRKGREDGFVDRILLSYPDPVKVQWTEEVVDPALTKQYVDACFSIREMTNGVLKLTREAKAFFATWFNSHNQRFDGPAGSWAKMDGYCARFASILHHLRLGYATTDQELVDVQDVRGAVSLVDYFKNHARRALGEMRSTKEARTLARLLAFVVNAPERRVRPRTLIGAQIASNADDAKAMLKKLESMGLGRMEDGKRKDEVFFVGRNDLGEVAGCFDELQSS